MNRLTHSESGCNSYSKFVKALSIVLQNKKKVYDLQNKNEVPIITEEGKDVKLGWLKFCAEIWKRADPSMKNGYLIVIIL